MKQFRIILLPLLVIVATSMACNLGAKPTSEPLEAIPVTTEAVGNLLDKARAFETMVAQGGDFELTITETEITSMAAFELQNQDPAPVDDIQIYLRDGQVRFLGSYTENNIKLPFEVIASPVVTTEGGFRMELVTAKIGPVAAPDILRDRAQELIDDAVRDAMGNQVGTNITVTSVEIADGVMTIRGHNP